MGGGSSVRVAGGGGGCGEVSRPLWLLLVLSQLRGALATWLLLQWYPLVKAVAIKGPPRLWPKPVLGAGLAALM